MCYWLTLSLNSITGSQGLVKFTSWIFLYEFYASLSRLSSNELCLIRCLLLSLSFSSSSHTWPGILSQLPRAFRLREEAETVWQLRPRQVLLLHFHQRNLQRLLRKRYDEDPKLVNTFLPVVLRFWIRPIYFWLRRRKWAAKRFADELAKMAPLLSAAMVRY